jgi:zinc transporter ZupT
MRTLAVLATILKTRHSRLMANILAFLLGLIALLLAIIGFIPLLGWLNWLIILIAGVGAAFGFASEKDSGRNFCLVVIAICALRLWIGGGII